MRVESSQTFACHMTSQRCPKLLILLLFLVYMTPIHPSRVHVFFEAFGMHPRNTIPFSFFAPYGQKDQPTITSFAIAESLDVYFPDSLSVLWEGHRQFHPRNIIDGSISPEIWMCPYCIRCDHEDDLVVMVDVERWKNAGKLFLSAICCGAD